MPEFTLRQLQLFAALPDHTTLSSAAASLRISESALSQAITALEKLVGEQLCVRRKARGLQLTPAGVYFAQRARRLLQDADALVHDLAGSSGELKGPVRLGCFGSFASNVLPAILEGLPRLHPGINIDVTIGTHDDLLPALDTGLLDFAIVYDMLLPAGYSQRTIYATELEAVLPPDHPLAAQDSVDLAQLADEPLIMYDTSPSTANTYQAFAERGLRPKVVANMPQLVLVQAMVGRGLGYGLLMTRPNSPAQTLEGRQVAVRPLDPPASQTSVVAIWPEEMRLSPRAEAVLGFAVQALHCET
ncbi:LysR family transcriptional regulator [Arthrobacter crystallopoietes BAB-32]|uniref:LysR family transcriptional regulator n=1 Tax=Arthrobacter crystallopoietes BAB-32 TaxID=1246476 RepID=N1UVD6_9MICC|nr:LysR family transcriptional regulator [Arthrobacter crystallopoietes]EMY33025.1 LysR family transcriptional regulator [Arthrobacter crystallopoietes BAB-32]